MSTERLFCKRENLNSSGRNYFESESFPLPVSFNLAIAWSMGLGIGPTVQIASTYGTLNATNIHIYELIEQVLVLQPIFNFNFDPSVHCTQSYYVNKSIILFFCHFSSNHFIDVIKQKFTNTNLSKTTSIISQNYIAWQ